MTWQDLLKLYYSPQAYSTQLASKAKPARKAATPQQNSKES